MGIYFCQQRLKKNMRCFYVKKFSLLTISLKPVKLLYFHKIMTIPGFKVTWGILGFFLDSCLPKLLTPVTANHKRYLLVTF